MASIYTHSYFIKNIIRRYDLETINLKCAISGSVLADLDLLANPHKKDIPLHYFWHNSYTGTNGIKFAKKLIKESRNNKEKSFAFGFLVHFVLDKNVHSYLHNQKVSNNEHAQIEYFVDHFFTSNKIYTYFPKKLIIKVFRKYFKKQYSKIKLKKEINKINCFTIFRFKVICYIIKKLAKSKYTKKKKRDLILFLIFKIVYITDKIFNTNFYDLYFPDFKFKKHNKYMIRKIKKSEKNIKKYLKLLK